MIAKTNATVLLVCVTDTPINDEMRDAMFEPSHSKVEFIEIIDYPKNLSKLEITNDLRHRLGKATGWSLVN